MAFYTRRQLMLLLALLAAAAAGLAVQHWRVGYPELAERVEQFDRQPEGRDGGAAPSAERQPVRKTAPPPGPSASPERAPLDLNQATADDLARLPGVGPALATRIVAAREADGRFGSIDDLRKVKGLGRARLERLRALVTVTE